MIRSRRIGSVLLLLAGVAIVLSCVSDKAGALPARDGTVSATAVTPPHKTLEKISRDKISEDSARRIAWGSGIDHVEDVLLADGRWQVAGRDRSGNEITVDIHVHDGRILDQTGLYAN